VGKRKALKNKGKGTLFMTIGQQSGAEEDRRGGYFPVVEYQCPVAGAIRIGGRGRKMRKLTRGEINRLLSRSGVSREAVEGFLSTMGADRQRAIANLLLFESLYKWNRATVRAILDGMELALTEG